MAAAKYAFTFDNNVTAKDRNGRTAMHAVVGSGGGGATQDQMTETVQYLAEIGVPLDEKDNRGRTPIQTGDGIPLDKPIQRMAEIIVGRGGHADRVPERIPEARSVPLTVSVSGRGLRDAASPARLLLGCLD